MAIPAPAGSLLTAAQPLDRAPARLLPVLSAFPDPRARRRVRHRLAVILGLTVCAVLAGARSFTRTHIGREYPVSRLEQLL
jgi:DDE_Tnp_1-associated